MLVNVEIICLAFYYLFDQDPDHRLILRLANLHYKKLEVKITIYNGKLSFSFVFTYFSYQLLVQETIFITGLHKHSSNAFLSNLYFYLKLQTIL